jgi:hypothetical protein
MNNWGVLTDRSGTITTGGTSQQLAPINPTRSYLFIQNPTTATEVLYVNFTSAAAAAASSISLAAGASFTMTASDFASTEAVNVFGATTGHAFTAKEG